MHPVSCACHGLLSKLRGKTGRRSGQPKSAAESKPQPSQVGSVLEWFAWIIPVAGSFGLFLVYDVIGLSGVALAALLLAFPWAPVV